MISLGAILNSFGVLVVGVLVVGIRRVRKYWVFIGCYLSSAVSIVCYFKSRNVETSGCSKTTTLTEDQSFKCFSVDIIAFDSFEQKKKHKMRQ